MKKLLFYVFLVLLSLVLGCRKHALLHTYYGDFDLDTMRVIYDDDSTEYYLVKMEKVDTAISTGLEMGKTYIAHFYKPCYRIYFSTVITEAGAGFLRTYYDPYRDSVICTEMFNPADSTIFCLQDYENKNDPVK